MNLSIERPEFADGLANRKRTATTGIEKIDNVTLSAPYDPNTAGPIIEFFEGKRSGDAINMSIQAVKRGKSLERRSTTSIRLSGCKLVKLSYPGEVDLNSGTEISMIEIELTVDDVSYAGTAAKDTTTASSLNI